MIRRRAFLLASGAVLSLSGAGFARQAAKSNVGKGRTIRLPGARAPIEIVEDAMGVPHIRARSKHDAFFGQGYVNARDRLFQIDLSNRRELGRMAEAFGPRFVAADQAARRLTSFAARRTPSEPTSTGPFVQFQLHARAAAPFSDDRTAALATLYLAARERLLPKCRAELKGESR